MLKVALRPNLMYPTYLIIWTFLRKIITILISEFFQFKGSIIYTFLMFLGELSGGYIFYRHQKKYTEKTGEDESKAKRKFSFVSRKNELLRADGLITIYFLVFMTAFFDFFEFILSTYYISKIHKISGTLQLRLGGILIIVSSLLYWFLLKNQIFKHQVVSIIIIGICFILLIISEYFFHTIDGIITYTDLTLAILFSVLSHVSIAFNNTIEKYLIDFNFINPFLILICQGIIGLIFTIICATVETPFQALTKVFETNSAGMSTLFVFLLLFYFIFGALKNIYRMQTILMFTPMNKHLADIMINPLYVIYYFSIGSDFIKDGNRDYLYFFTNLILLIIFDICGLIFNEFLILFCCSLDHNTYESIKERASRLEEMENMEDNEKKETNDDDI